MSDQEKTLAAAPSITEEVAATPPPIDAAKTHQVAEFKHEKPLTTCRIDPTGRFVFAGAEDLNVYRWDLESGEKVKLAGHESWVRSMDFSQDGKWLYTAGWDGQLRWWETGVDSPSSARTIQAHQGFARWVQASPCGTMLVTCGNDKLVRIWDAESGEKLAEMAGHLRHPYAVVFHPQVGQLVSQDLMGDVRIWDVPATAQVATIDASVMTGYDNKFAADMGGARDMQFDPQGSTLATAGITNVVNSFAGVQDPIIALVDWTSKTITHHLIPAESATGIAWGVRFHPGGFIVGAVAQQNGRGMLLFWRPNAAAPELSEQNEAQQKPLEVKPFHTLALDKCARGLDLTPDARRLAIPQSDGYVRVYEMAEGPASETEAEKTG